MKSSKSNPEMRHIFARRLVFFSQVLAVLWIVSVIAVLHRLDSRDFQRDLDALDLLGTTYEVKDETLHDHAAVLDGVWRILQQDHPDLDSTRREIRLGLIDWLKQEGISEEILEDLRGKPYSRLEPIPFYVVEVEADTVSPPVGGGVDTAIAVLVEQAEPRQISVATGLDTSDAYLMPPSEFKLVEVRLKGQSIKIVQEGIPDPRSQEESMQVTTLVEATTERITGPSLLELAEEPSAEIDAAITLGRSPTTLDRLRAHYGHLSIETAQLYASTALSNSLASIDILGFSFSPRWIPLAILFGNLLLMTVIFNTVRVARRHELGILGQDVDAGALKILIDRKALRLASWVVLPPLAVWLAVPEAPLTGGETTVLIAGSVILFLLGLASFVQSKRM